MRPSLLATPGKLRSAQAVRRELAWLISQAEIAVARGQNPERAFVQIREFLTSAVDYVNTAAPVYSITNVAAPTSILANNTALSTLTINVKANGLNAAGKSVVLTKGGAQAATCTLSASSGVTDASGNLVVTLKGTAAGTCTVTAVSEGKSAVATVTLT